MTHIIFDNGRSYFVLNLSRFLAHSIQVIHHTSGTGSGHIVVIIQVMYVAFVNLLKIVLGTEIVPGALCILIFIKNIKNTCLSI